MIKKYLEVVAKLRFSRFSGLFEPIFRSFLGGNTNIRILPPKKERKSGQKSSENRRTLSFATTSLTLFALCLCSFVCSAPLQDRQINPEALFQLASELGLPAEENIVEATQKRWLRKSLQERWEMAELSAEHRSFVLRWAEEQGVFSPWKPACGFYDKALILGASTSHMSRRLAYLKDAWNEGVRFREIVWLTGDRPLTTSVDDLIGRCQNESEAARILWQEAELPEEMRALPVVFIAVPMKKEGARLQRPNTQDTLIAWLDASPEPCKALFVSDQPFCGYQFSIIKTCLPNSFLFDVIGEGANPASHPAAAAITLDSIARWIYQDTLAPVKTTP